MMVRPFAPCAGKLWDCPFCYALAGEAHDVECTLHAVALIDRHAFIARAHLSAKHPMAVPDEASKWLAERDEMIADLREQSLWDRTIFDAELAKLADQIDRLVRHRARYYHLDEGSDGKWPRPSWVAAVKDCLALMQAEAGTSDTASGVGQFAKVEA